MNHEVAQKLLDLNRFFYGNLAQQFATSRMGAEPGYERLRQALPRPCPSLLDVGCGHGRLGHYLLAEQAIQAYVGVDFTVELLDWARQWVDGMFYQRDLSQPDCLAGLGQHAAVACLATLHHIPGQENRGRLLREMAGCCLRPNGRLILTTWQFMDSPRQRRKVRDWAEIGLSPDDVDPGDYLLTWQRGGFGLRYVHRLDEQATAVLAQAAGLQILKQFRSDGQEGNLSLYTILTHA